MILPPTVERYFRRVTHSACRASQSTTERYTVPQSAPRAPQSSRNSQNAQRTQSVAEILDTPPIVWDDRIASFDPMRGGGWQPTEGGGGVDAVAFRSAAGGGTAPRAPTTTPTPPYMKRFYDR
eukprot:gene9580-biopygen673